MAVAAAATCRLGSLCAPCCDARATVRRACTQTAAPTWPSPSRSMRRRVYIHTLDCVFASGSRVCGWVPCWLGCSHGYCRRHTAPLSNPLQPSPTLSNPLQPSPLLPSSQPRVQTSRCAAPHRRVTCRAPVLLRGALLCCVVQALELREHKPARRYVLCLAFGRAWMHA